MSSSRCVLLRSFKKHLINRRPKTVLSSPFNAANFGGIGMEFITDIPGLRL
jgi:hypothetical protein